MPDLAHSFPSKDLGFLRIVASLWGVELTLSDPALASAELAEALCDAGLIEEIVSTLPADGRAALEALVSAGGRISWVIFARRFGDVREMGAGRRDREQPHLHPASAAEMLWYRALLAKTFFDTDKGPQEFAYIPDDLLLALEFAGVIGEAESDKMPQIPAKKTPPVQPGKTTGEPLGRPASPGEKAHLYFADDHVLDVACTLLAALRMGIEPPATSIATNLLSKFLSSTKIITEDGTLQPESVRNFLEAPRQKALELLRDGWQKSDRFNELRLLPGLVVEGEWKNQPQETREFVLKLLEPIPDGQWWSLSAFIRDIKQKYPDYQRPAGDYDSWFIKREADGAFLRGFGSWDEVDGALIRFIITGPLHWLGLVDLASPDDGAAPTAFRSARLPAKLEDAKLTVTSQGRIAVPRLVPRASRYQIARFCAWDEEKADEYRYHVTVDSLDRARQQGLKADHLLAVLRKHAGSPIPPPFVRSLQRWEMNGTEAKLESMVVLKVSKPEVLKELKESKAGRFLGEQLGPVTVVVKPGAQAKVMAALAELGMLVDFIKEEAE
jgi:hypothetical protein